MYNVYVYQDMVFVFMHIRFAWRSQCAAGHVKYIVWDNRYILSCSDFFSATY